jgi:hypothetical protein
MSLSPPKHIEQMDWRINNLTWTTAPFTPPGSSAPVPVESAITQTALIHHGQQRVGITIPNATALFLGLSEQYHVEAQHWAGKCIVGKNKFGQLPDHEAFTFYERITFLNTANSFTGLGLTGRGDYLGVTCSWPFRPSCHITGLQPDGRKHLWFTARRTKDHGRFARQFKRAEGLPCDSPG